MTAFDPDSVVADVAFNGRAGGQADGGSGRRMLLHAARGTGDRRTLQVSRTVAASAAPSLLQISPRVGPVTCLQIPYYTAFHP